MSDLMFVLKTFIFTLVLVVFLQIKWGHQTLETRYQNWLHQSSITQYVQETAAGGVKLLEKGGKEVSAFFGRTHKQASGETERAGKKLKAEWLRSKSYLEKKASQLTE